MEREEITILGLTNYRNVRRRFGIKAHDRRRHAYVVGKTGTGKSTLLLNCIVQDVRRGHGVAVIDPHGDLVERVLEYIPPRRVNETIYFTPADREFPIGFNVLEPKGRNHRHLTASGLVQVFKKIWVDSWGPRLEYVFRNAILALLERPGSTLLGVPRLLTDDRFRKRVLGGVKDAVVRNFWRVEFEDYPKVFRTETISPIQNKVGQFLSTPLIRNVLGQTKTRFDLLEVLDSGKILLLNLAKGKIGEDNSSLLGSLMLTELYLAALRRSAVVEEERRDFYLYIDELQSFVTDDFPSILSEARKYGLSIAAMANQFLSQLPSQLASAILGNIGTLIAFTVGSEDAEVLSREFYPVFSPEDLVSLPNHEVCLKLSIDGTTSRPFSARTLPPLSRTSASRREAVIDQSRQRFAAPRSEVEERIKRWFKSGTLHR